MAQDYKETLLDKLCECGCNNRLKKDKGGRKRRFRKGHYIRTIDQNGEKGRSWKGGRRKSNGYWELYMPNYIRSNSRRYVFEHVYNYQESHKLCMLPWGHVHHRNGNTEQNLPWNLQGLMNYQHSLLHHPRIDKSDRYCSSCSSSTTNKDKHGYEYWYNNKNGGFWCNRCYIKVYRRVYNL